MKSNDYVSFLTKMVVTHLETPKEERLKRKNEKKLQREPFVYKWFGIFPYSVIMSWKMRRKQKQK